MDRKKKKKKHPAADGFGRGESNPVLPATYLDKYDEIRSLAVSIHHIRSIISLLLEVSPGMLGVYLNSNTHQRNHINPQLNFAQIDVR
jgi:hypothetical protein